MRNQQGFAKQDQNMHHHQNMVVQKNEPNGQKRQEYHFEDWEVKHAIGSGNQNIFDLEMQCDVKINKKPRQNKCQYFQIYSPNPRNTDKAMKMLKNKLKNVRKPKNHVQVPQYGRLEQPIALPRQQTVLMEVPKSKVSPSSEEKEFWLSGLLESDIIKAKYKYFCQYIIFAKQKGLQSFYFKVFLKGKLVQYPFPEDQIPDTVTYVGYRVKGPSKSVQKTKQNLDILLKIEQQILSYIGQKDTGPAGQPEGIYSYGDRVFYRLKQDQKARIDQNGYSQIERIAKHWRKKEGPTLLITIYGNEYLFRKSGNEKPQILILKGLSKQLLLIVAKQIQSQLNETQLFNFKLPGKVFNPTHSQKLTNLRPLSYHQIFYIDPNQAAKIIGKDFQHLIDLKRKYGLIEISIVVENVLRESFICRGLQIKANSDISIQAAFYNLNLKSDPSYHSSYESEFNFKQFLSLYVLEKIQNCTDGELQCLKRKDQSALTQPNQLSVSSVSNDISSIRIPFQQNELEEAQNSMETQQFLKNIFENWEQHDGSGVMTEQSQSFI